MSQQNATAVLSIDLDTTKAKESLRKFKTQLATEGDKLDLAFNEDKLLNQVRTFFNNRNLAVRVNPGALNSFHQKIVEAVRDAERSISQTLPTALRRNILEGVVSGLSSLNGGAFNQLHNEVYKATRLGVLNGATEGLAAAFALERFVRFNDLRLTQDVDQALERAFDKVRQVRAQVSVSGQAAAASSSVAAAPLRPTGINAESTLSAASIAALISGLQTSMAPTVAALSEVAENFKKEAPKRAPRPKASETPDEPSKGSAGGGRKGKVPSLFGDDEDDDELKATVSRRLRAPDGTSVSVSSRASAEDLATALRNQAALDEEERLRKLDKEEERAYQEYRQRRSILTQPLPKQDERTEAQVNRDAARRAGQRGEGLGSQSSAMQVLAELDRKNEASRREGLDLVGRNATARVRADARADSELSRFDEERSKAEVSTFFKDAVRQARGMGLPGVYAATAAAQLTQGQFGTDRTEQLLKDNSGLLSPGADRALVQYLQKMSGDADQRSTRLSNLEARAEGKFLAGNRNGTVANPFAAQRDLDAAQRVAEEKKRNDEELAWQKRRSTKDASYRSDLDRLQDEAFKGQLSSSAARMAAEAEEQAFVREQEQKVRAAASANRATLGRLYARLKADAEALGATPELAKLTAARSLSKRVGEGNVREMLGNSQYILDPSFADKVERGLKEAADKVAQDKQRSQIARDRKEGAFEGVGETSPIAILRKKIREAEVASSLIAKGNPLEAVIRETSEAAVKAVPEIAKLRAEYAELKAGIKDPEAEAIFKRMTALAGVTRPDLDATGRKILGAQMTANEVGEERTRKAPTRSAYLDMVPDIDRFVQSNDKARLSMKSFSDIVKEAHFGVRGFAGSLGQMWLTWGSTAPLLAGAAVGAAVSTIISEGAKLEYQLKFVQLLSEGATVSMQDFYNAASQGIAAPVQAAEGLRALAQNGLDSQEALRALPDVLRLATAGEMDFRDAALGATGVLEAFNLEVSDIGRVADVFSKAAASSNTDVKGMVEAMKQASIVSDQYNVSLEETAASLEVLAKRNITNSAAGTAFRNMLVELVSPSENARKAMERVGLEVFDNNGQIKNFRDLMKELNDKTKDLDPKSKTQFFQALFNERSVKAASALVQNFDELIERTRVLETQSRGFTKALTDGLSETALVKLQKTLAEFKFSSAEVFEQDAASFKNMLDELREAVSSEDFKTGLSAVAEGVAQVGRFLIEYGPEIAKAAGYFYLLKASLAAFVSGAASLTVVKAGVTGASGGFLATLLRLNPVLMGTGTLLAGIVALFALNRKETDKVSESLRSYGNSLEKQSENLLKETASLKERNEVLYLQNQYMDAGLSAIEARARAESDLKRKVQETNLEMAKRSLLEADQGIAEIEARQKSRPKKPNVGITPVGLILGEVLNLGAEERADAKQLEKLKRQREEAERAINLAEGLKRDQAVADGETAKERDASRRTDFRDKLTKLFNENKARNASGKFASRFEALNPQSLDELSASDLELMFKRISDDTNSKLDKFTAPSSPDSAAERARRDSERKDDNALRNFIQDQKRDERKISSRMDAESNLLRESLSGNEYLLPIAEEMDARSKNIQLIAYEEAALKDLIAQRDKLKNLSESGRDNLKSEIDAKNDRISELRAKNETDAAISRIKEQSRRRKEDRALTLDLDQAEADSYQSLEQLRQSYSKEVQDPVEFARAKAESEAKQKFVSILTREQSKLADVIAERANVERLLIEEQDRGLDTDQEKVERLRGLLQANRTYSEALEQNIEAIRKFQDAAGSRAGGEAARLQAESMTYKSGVDQFFKDLRSSAENDAQVIYNVMRKTTDGMTSMIENFAKTGKLNFSDFANSVLSEILRVVTSRASTQFLELLGGKASGAGGSSGFLGFATSVIQGFFPGSGGASSGSGSSAYALPTQGIKLGYSGSGGTALTPEGVLPARRYSSGGIARQGQVAVYGEGRQPEAYVPLPDGRTIPVTLSATGSTGNSSPVVIINNYSGTPVTQEETVDSRGQRRIEVTVGEIAAKEARRPGSSLNSAVRQSFAVRPSLIGR